MPIFNSNTPWRAWPLLACILVGAPGWAAHPANSSLQVAERAGGEVLSHWTGVIPAGLETGPACISTGRFDSHQLRPILAPGLEQDFATRLTATLAGVGPGEQTADLMLTVVRPDGSTQTADAGADGAPEAVGLDDVTAGVYEIRACAVGGATPQRFRATASIRSTPRPAKDAFWVPSSDSACTPPAQSQKFEQNYIDEARAGGEPFIFRHPDGHLLWGSHAGTTHFYSPAAPSPATGPFVENYEGQTYYYIAEAESGYRDWHFIPRQGPGPGDVAPVAGVPASGFSDPEFAVDAIGNVFVSEINLANIAVSKSTDGGRSYGLQNVAALTASDRQWMAADREDELYIAASGVGGGSFPGGPAGETGHFLTKSTDGGVTFAAPFSIDPIIGDLQIDKQRGILYSLHEAGGTLSMARFPNIREESDEFTVEILPIAIATGMSGVQRQIDPTFDMDAEGNLYATWYENGQGARPQGVYYAYSTNQGDSWSFPARVDPSEEDEVWPWLAVGAPGQVVISWLQTDTDTPDPLPGEAGSGTPVDRLQSSPNKPWQVVVAHSSSGLGCRNTTDAPGAALAAFTVTQASTEPPHTGTICQGGTLCQAQVVDRRLGDYFTIEVAGDGSVHVAVADTRKGGAVALPLHLRQIDGPTLNAAPEPAPTVAVVSSRAELAPARGGGLPLLTLLLFLVLARRTR